jgi:predicted ribosomally synthesized peptide with SipW-like signal peptide
MKKTLGLILIALLAVGLVGGYTLAYFSDTETSHDNTWTAGTLNLTVNDKDGENAIVFTVTNANPGESGAGTWTLKNVGTVDGDITLSGILVTNAENYELATNEAELYHAATNPGGDADTFNATGVGELGANLDVVLFVDDGTGGGTAGNGIKDGTEASIYSGKLDGIAAYTPPLSLALAGGGTTYISMTWSVDSGVGNTIIGDSAQLDMTFVLTQATTP